MAILKWQRGVNDWVQLYGNILRNRLRRDKNLSDLTDTLQAKKNLGLFGDVVDHHHDNRYMPIVTRIESKLDREIQDRLDSEKALDSQLRTKAESEVNAAIESFGVSVSQEGNLRKQEDNNIRQMHEKDKVALEKQIAKETTDRMSDKEELINRIDMERGDRAIAIMQEAESRNKAITKAKQEMHEEGDQIGIKVELEAKARDEAIEAKASELLGRILQEVSDRDAAIAEARSALIAAITNEASIRDANKDELDNVVKALTNLIDQRYKDTEALVNTYSEKYFVGPNPPENPVDRQTLWFNTTDGKEEIRIYKNGKWTLFGAGYL